MNGLRQLVGLVVAVTCVSGWFTGAATAQVLTDSTPALAPLTRSLPRYQPRKSPVDSFRELLAMTPDEREKSIANRPLEIRKRMEAKISEYQSLAPSEREVRLRATELHWYLRPLMNLPRDQRSQQLALVPDDLRELVESRLDSWDILPPELKTELLDNEMAVRYFAQLKSSPNETVPRQPQLEENIRHWQALSDQQRASAEFRFNQFFELTPDERQKTLETFSQAEQRQMQKTLNAFDKMPPQQRAICVQAFNKFASLSTSERQQFLANAERWRQMSPEERQQWRTLVTQVPDWPPLPQGYLPESSTN